MSEIILMHVTSNDRLIFVVETRDLNKSRKTDDKMKRRKNVKTKTPKKPNKQTKKKKKPTKKPTRTKHLLISKGR